MTILYIRFISILVISQVEVVPFDRGYVVKVAKLCIQLIELVVE